jgi:hypothetical protein
VASLNTTAKTKADKGKRGFLVMGASRERKQLDRKLVRLPRRNRSALNVERRAPMEMVRLSAKLKVVMNRWQ